MSELTQQCSHSPKFDIIGYFLLFGKNTLKLQNIRRLRTEYELFNSMRIKMRCMAQLTNCSWDPIRCERPLDELIIKECRNFYLFLLFTIYKYIDNKIKQIRLLIGNLFVNYRICSSCSITEEHLGIYKCCGACKNAFYCNADCQRLHWSTNHILREVSFQ